MYTLTGDEVTRQPQRLIDSARRGEALVVRVAGEPVLLAWPLDKSFASGTSLVDFAATLFDCEQISLGLSARIAGLSYSEMIDELGRRNIPVVRYRAGELDRELEYFRSLREGR